MNRGVTLPAGCKNLSDRIRVISVQGRDLGFLTVAEAQRLATDQQAELIQIARGHGMHIFRLVDGALRIKLRKKK